MNDISDILSFNSERIGQKWIKLIRKSENTKAYNAITDEELMKITTKVYKLLELWFEKEADKNSIGGFFVELGKTRRKDGFAVSEIAYALFLGQRAILDFISNENVDDSSMALYSALNTSRQVADFFFLGSFYMTKGFLEDTVLQLNKNENIPLETLKRYFTDDFFFKNLPL
jgi:hypothetical protein